jgi:hypothetical protein
VALRRILQFVVSLPLSLFVLAAFGNATGLDGTRWASELFSFREGGAMRVYILYVLNAIGIGVLNLLVPSGRAWWLIPIFNSVVCSLLAIACRLLLPAGPGIGM